MEEMVELIQHIIDYLCGRTVPKKEFFLYIENELGVYEQEFRLLYPELKKCGFRIVKDEVFMVDNTPLSLPPNQEI